MSNVPWGQNRTEKHTTTLVVAVERVVSAEGGGEGRLVKAQMPALRGGGVRPETRLRPGGRGGGRASGPFADGVRGVRLVLEELSERRLIQRKAVRGWS